VNLPDKAGRQAILKVHTRSVPLARGVDLGELAASTPGLSGADLRNLVNEAALLAGRPLGSPTSVPRTTATTTRKLT
jgi:cell division protease FtsH